MISKNKILFSHRDRSVVKAYSPEQISNILDFQYMPTMRFLDAKSEKEIKRQCAYAYEEECLDEECLWLGKLYGDKIDEGFHQEVSVRWINDDLGYGLFAECHIPAYSLLMEYSGIVRRRNLVFHNVNEYCFSYPTSFLFYKKYTIDAEIYGNLARFANHSEDPNCESLSVYHRDLLYIIIRSLKDIQAGEQITYDYTEQFWQRRKAVPNV